MERRKIRQLIAQQLEGKILNEEQVARIRTLVLGETPSEEDTKEFGRQLDFVLEPLVKKLRRAQGHGKQTGHILSSESGVVVLGSPVSAPDLTEVEDHETTAAA